MKSFGREGSVRKSKDRFRIGVGYFSFLSTSSAVLLFSQHKKYTDVFEADKMRTVKQSSGKLEQ